MIPKVDHINNYDFIDHMDEKECEEFIKDELGYKDVKVKSYYAITKWREFPRKVTSIQVFIDGGVKMSVNDTQGLLSAWRVLVIMCINHFFTCHN